LCPGPKVPKSWSSSARRRRALSHSESSSDWARFFDLLHPESGDRILDVGSGAGEKAARVLAAAPGSEVFAVDPNPKRIGQAKRDHPEVKSSVAGAEKLPFEDAYFDKAYSTMAFHHFLDIDKALGEIARVLKHGGSYVLLEVEPRSFAGRMFRFFGRLMGEPITIMTEAQCLSRVRAGEGFVVDGSVSLGSKYLVRLRRT